MPAVVGSIRGRILRAAELSLSFVEVSSRDAWEEQGHPMEASASTGRRVPGWWSVVGLDSGQSRDPSGSAGGARPVVSLHLVN